MNLLVINQYTEYPVRMTAWDHMYCFRRHGNCRVYYVNMAYQTLPEYLLRIPFNAIIFHTTLLSFRWNLNDFERSCRKLESLKNLDTLKIVMPQDEFIQSDALCQFINDFKVDLVYSVLPASEWKKIYRFVDFSKVSFKQILTGYVEEKFAKKLCSRGNEAKHRDIDIGYRAWHAPYWLGRQGQKKVEIARNVKEAAKREWMNVDISTNNEDVILGEKWYDFLLNCKTVIGVEGGASVLDHNGKIKQKTEAYIAKNPTASFEEVEKHCFPNLDGYLNGFAISPRHFEACMTYTCQVLLEGEYNGVLKPNLHYIELKEDYSNLSDVLEKIKDNKLRERLTERAYNDVVASGKYFYSTFVNSLLNEINYLNCKSPMHSYNLYYLRNRVEDKLCWWFIKGKNMLRRHLPKKFYNSLKKFVMR